MLIRNYLLSGGEMNTKVIQRGNRTKHHNWKISYSVIQTGQQNLIFQQTSTFLHCKNFGIVIESVGYKDKFHNTCPADVRLLKDYTHELKAEDSTFINDIDKDDCKEYESKLDLSRSDSLLKPSKLKIWDEYKRLLQLRTTPKPAGPKQWLKHITSLPKICVDRYSLRTCLTYWFLLFYLRLGEYKSQPRPHATAKRSIIRSDIQKQILVADCNYVQFRNFQLKKLYKKIVNLQNVSTMPVKFHMGARPYNSNFTVMIEFTTDADRNIVPPGIQVQLVIFFRCDSIDEPEEILVLNVENGKPLIIRLHGYKDPPILLVQRSIIFNENPIIKMAQMLRVIGLQCVNSKRNLFIKLYKLQPSSLKEDRKSSVEPWHQEIPSSNGSTETSEESSSDSGNSWVSGRHQFISPTFDCKKVFVGERVLESMKFKNVGGQGRFFIMSEIDWISMHIDDITIADVLKLSSFVIYPAYFILKPQEEMILHVYFLPRHYGIHVDKLYILCDNCIVLGMEMIGDGIMYEPNFIQISKRLHDRLFERFHNSLFSHMKKSHLSLPPEFTLKEDETFIQQTKNSNNFCLNHSFITNSSQKNHLLLKFQQLEKVMPLDGDIDKRARYYVKLSTSRSNEIGQRTISVLNISEIRIHFRWEKRMIQFDQTEENIYDHLPLEFLQIYPDHGVLLPISEHRFSITAERGDSFENTCFAVLQLYVEDIPLMAISSKLKLETSNCIHRRRITPAVNHFIDLLIDRHIWIADVEVWLEVSTSEDEGRKTSDESLLESPSDDYSIEDGRVESRTTFDTEDSEESKCERKLYYLSYSNVLQYAHELKLNTSILQGVEDELFLHYDVVNLKQFEPLLREHIISIGIIRPTRHIILLYRTLYIGIEETYILSVKNISRNSLTFSWGETSGFDTEKIKLCVCPEKGEVPAKNAEKMKITLTPMKEGIVQSLHMPCFVGDKQKIIMLGIECTIEPLYVAFYFPLNDEEPLELKNSFTRVEWRVDSLQIDLDMAQNPKARTQLLEKYRKREEQELMNTDLDEGSVLRDTSAGPSESEVYMDYSEEKPLPSTCTSEVIQTSNLINEDTQGRIIPFYETILPPSTQSVIEFLNLPLEKVKKKTFVIRNETAIPTTFSFRIKNFYPIECSCEWKSKKDRVRFMYKRIFGCKKSFIEEIVYRMKQPDSGVVIYVDPLYSNLGPFEAIPVDIYVFADTWGIYVDELEINITGLPRYTLGICIQVVESPIYLCIGGKSGKVPTIKYGVQPSGTRLQTRKISVKNTSVIPIAIDWHTFIIKSRIESIPFNVIFDVYTPFTDKLASKLKGKRQKSDSEVHLEKHAKSQVKSKMPNDSADQAFIDALESNITDYTSSTSGSFSYMNIGTVSDKDLQTPELSEKTSKSSPKSLKVYNTSTYYNASTNSTETEEEESCECNIAILPYYGLADTLACTVIPRETFILPKQTTIVRINALPEKCISGEKCEQEFYCKILGFLRIAPSDKYKDNQYSRQDGQYFPPIEIDVTAKLIKPQLMFDIPKSERTFKCCINDVIESKKKQLELRKTFFFYNNENTVVNVALETVDPFHIKSVSIYAESNPCHTTGIICINEYGYAEVEMLCIIDDNMIETILYASEIEDLHESTITLKGPLVIIHSDSENQELELILEIWLPSMRLSRYTLDFGHVYIGDTKKLLLNIENLSVCNHSFTVKQKERNEDFTTDQIKGKLLSHYDKEYCNFVITVSFQPRKVGQSTETLEVITDIPYSVEECELYGEGTLDEKYHTPGI
ncbi:uncharacterized protein LOC143188336 [Calliopsis andreniformis]|uniref:uncharacterized protein LOC143188336 n=1 Tax=Calliopsis andreniformis TaxID=337506 RepID=UPI003FCDA9DF